MDSYLTISTPSECVIKIKSSKFLTYAYPIDSEEQIPPLLEALRKRYYDATHHCYAWRLGVGGERFRANDDGEPSSTAGKPILGQMVSREVTNCLIVVVRYFGGTKLGVSGLIEAYRDAAAEVLEVSDVVELTVNREVEFTFSYMVMNGVMRCVKEMEPKIILQEFDNLCRMRLSIRESLSERLIGKLMDIDGVTIHEGE